MTDRIKISKRDGVWKTTFAGHEQPHPTFALALAHAQHLLTPDTQPSRTRFAQDPDRLAQARFRRAMRRAARQEGEVA